MDLANALASPQQLQHSSSALDGVPAALERSVRFAGARLTQAAGVLLGLPQDVVAHAVVLFTRFWVGPAGGSLAVYPAKDVSAAALFTAAKLSFTPVSPRTVITVYTLLTSPSASPLAFVNPDGPPAAPAERRDDIYLSKSAFLYRRQRLLRAESALLRSAAFAVRVVVPHAIALTYLQALALRSPSLAARVVAHLNAALLSPQLLYLTHQPNALAVAAIYLAAREEAVKVVDGSWWEVFDVGREELGFLVVALASIAAFARAEERLWAGKRVPLSVLDDLSLYDMCSR